MVEITGVEKGSPAEKAGISAGDRLVSIGGKTITDVLDYRFYMCEKNLTLTLRRGEEEFSVKIKKGEYDDIGLDFATYLMDEKRRCANNCIICFIDQNPCGMRESIYFKDDDSRLSFLQGNYITLTNLGEKDIKRIIDMKMSPVNISVHTMNPELRVKMLRNKNAGKVLSYLKTLDDGGINMNCQIVLCKGINDGAELDRSMRELAEYPHIHSASIVPSGLTCHREGLYPLKLFSPEEAGAVIDQVESFAAECEKKRGEKIFYCGDELYIRAGRELHSGEYYGDYTQIDNGVGMITSTREEYLEALEFCDENPPAAEISMATGVAAYGLIRFLADETMKKFPQIIIHVYKTINHFFGESVTVAGLVTGKDLCEQVSGKPLGNRLLISEHMLRHGGDLFLCGMSIDELAEKLGVHITTCPDDGYEILERVIGNIK